MPALLHNIKATINNNPSLRECCSPISKRERLEGKGKRGKSYAKFHVLLDKL